jgi:hypothetical protein
MKCFYHPQTDAVAFCKNCSRGLCMECVADVGNGVACKGKCESEVQGFNEMIQRGVRNNKILGGYYKMWATFFGLGGLTVLIIGFLSWENIKSVFLIPMVLIPIGLISLFASFFYFLLQKNHSGKK